MATRSINNCDRSAFERLKKYQLPASFRAIGLVLTAICFVTMFLNAFTANNLVLRETVKYGMLIGLLISSISKDKIEDELVISLRLQSYAVAFILGILLALIQPFANYLVDNTLGNEAVMLKDSGDFVILWTLLGIQVLYFEVLKRWYK